MTLRRGRFLCGIWIVGLLGVPATALASEVRIRVLVLEAAGPVHIQEEGGRLRVLSSVGGRLQESGAPVATPLYLDGPGPLDVDGRRYRGGLEVMPTENGLAVVNEVDLEDYVAGCVAREIPASWQSEAQRTQAIVSRTYALHHRDRAGERPWHLGATTAGQVYAGIDTETEASRNAARDTAGEYLSFDGRPLLAVFHAAAGGRTAAAGEVWEETVPYLQSLPVVEEEDSPWSYWRAPFTRDELSRALAVLGEQVGDIEALSVAERSESGRAHRVRVRGRDATVDVRATALRDALGATRVRSTLFDVRPFGDGFVFVGSGSGHGVGLSQWGARAMVARGALHTEILARFYPGSTLRRMTAP